MAENPRVEELRRRLDKEPGSRLFAQLAEELRKEGELGEAIRVSRTGLSLHPNYPSARMTLGRALLDSGDLPAARAEFEAVLRGAPDNILASRFLAECLEAMGDLGSALLQYRALLRLAAGDRQIEAQIRMLEERLTPPRRPAGGPPAAAPRPAAPPAAPPPAPPATRAPRPPGRGPHAQPGAPPAAAPAAGPPPVAAMRSRPVAPGPPPVNTDRSAQPLEESFELEAPFDASPRLSAADPSLLRPLPLDVTLDGTIDETAPTLPLSSAPRFEAPPRAAPPPAPPPPAAPPAAPAVASPPVAPPPVLRSVPPPPPPAPAVVTPETAALSSSTLAELYFRQGFVDKAIEVYQQLLQRGPENERSRARLGELRALLAPSVPPTVVPPAAAAAPEDERTTRRRAIESAIARLEDLLVTIRRNAPATGPR